MRGHARRAPCHRGACRGHPVMVRLRSFAVTQRYPASEPLRGISLHQGTGHGLGLSIAQRDHQRASGRPGSGIRRSRGRPSVTGQESDDDTILIVDDATSCAPKAFSKLLSEGRLHGRRGPPGRRNPKVQKKCRISHSRTCACGITASRLSAITRQITHLRHHHDGFPHHASKPPAGGFDYVLKPFLTSRHAPASSGRRWKPGVSCARRWTWTALRESTRRHVVGRSRPIRTSTKPSAGLLHRSHGADPGESARARSWWLVPYTLTACGGQSRSRSSTASHPENLLESELFDLKRALSREPHHPGGKIEQANGGTVFLRRNRGHAVGIHPRSCGCCRRRASSV